MPTYVYRCSVCGSETEAVFPIGRNPEKYACDCGAVQRQVLGVGLYIAADATPSKRHQVRTITQRELRWSHDMPAYKEARAAGLQPRTIDGCRGAMRGVEDQVDIDYRLKGKARKANKNKILELSEMMTGKPPRTVAE